MIQIKSQKNNLNEYSMLRIIKEDSDKLFNPKRSLMRNLTACEFQENIINSKEKLDSNSINTTSITQKIFV